MTTIRVLDVETSGMEPPEAEVCEVGWVDVASRLDGDWDILSIHSHLCSVGSMPPEVRAVHHITMSDLVGSAPFITEDALIADEPIHVLAAHSASFEQKFITPVEQPWICTYKCALRVWPEAPGHSNQVLRYWLEDQGLLSLDADKAMPPHRAGPDAYVTAHILLALLKVATVEQMIEWTKEPRLLPRCTIGKFRGKPWAEVEWGFLNWMLQQPTMEEDLKWNARREIERRASAASK